MVGSGGGRSGSVGLRVGLDVGFAYGIIRNRKRSVAYDRVMTYREWLCINLPSGIRTEICLDSKLDSPEYQ